MAYYWPCLVLTYTFIIFQAIWKHMYHEDGEAAILKGSLHQLKTAIKRSDVPSNPANNMNSSEAFLRDSLTAYILAGACSILEIDNASSLLETSDVPACFASIKQLANSIVEEFTDLTSYGIPPLEYIDEINRYTKDLMTVGLIWAAYQDAIKQGDGKRIIGIWRHLMLIFRLSGRTNYAHEVATFLTQVEYLASPKLKCQMMYSRFINVHGQVGKNILCDLHMEHLNRYMCIIASKITS